MRRVLGHRQPDYGVRVLCGRRPMDGDRVAGPVWAESAVLAAIGGRLGQCVRRSIHVGPDILVAWDLGRSPSLMYQPRFL
jgi:hypothetical protein